MKIQDHTNLTVISNGKSNRIDSAPHADDQPVSWNATDRKNEGILQSRSDTGNCAAMSLGAVESFLKQIRKLKNDASKSNEKYSGKNFGDYMDSFLNAKVPIEYLNGESTLLPPKYLRYLQSKTRIDKFLEMAKNKDPQDKDYEEVQQVKKEFEKVKKNYFKLDINGYNIPPKYKKYLQSREAADEFLEMAKNKDPQDKDYEEVQQVAEILEKEAIEVNARAEMKRQTEILKISQFVDSLQSNGIDAKEDINQIRTF